MEMVEFLNYCDLTKKDIFLEIIRAFNKCRVLGNMNTQKGFATFFKKYLSAVWYLGYTRCYMFETFYIEANVDCAIDKMPDEIRN
ncbi:MAG: hypothetical protein Q4F24_17820, partial [Eubacteriales bacterium]|nr:hypothetical protein [Eubacteriales bacterium]